MKEVHGRCGDGGLGEHGGTDDRHCSVCIDKCCKYNQPDRRTIKHRATVLYYRFKLWRRFG